jgi:hypothetical protein
MLRQKSAFLVMVLSVVGLVLYVTLFSEILSAMETIRTYTNIATFTALLTVVEIAPVVLLLAGVFGASFGYYKGFKGAGGQDPSGILRMVLGVILIILFVTLFYTIVGAFYTLYGADNASEYTAFQTVVQIAPTVLFLGGIFAGGATAVSGARSFRRRRHSRLR